MCFRIFQIRQNIGSHQVTTITFSIKLGTFLSQSMLYPRNITKFRKHLKVFIRTEEISHTSPMLPLGFTHFRMINIIEHQVNTTDIIIIPIFRLIRSLCFAICPLTFISIQSFYHVIRFKITTENFIRLPCIIHISEEHVIQSPCIRFKVVIGSKDRCFCLLSFGINLQKFVI